MSGEHEDRGIQALLDRWDEEDIESSAHQLEAGTGSGAADDSSAITVSIPRSTVLSDLLRPVHNLAALDEQIRASSSPDQNDETSAERVQRNAPLDFYASDGRLTLQPRRISALRFPSPRPSEPQAGPSAGNIDVSPVWQAWTDLHAPYITLNEAEPSAPSASGEPTETDRLLGSGTTSEDTAAARLAAVRRRRRVLSRGLDFEDMSMSMDNSYAMNEGGEADAYPWENIMDPGSEDEDDWVRRSLYTQPNITGDEIDGWTTTLRRGANNRRRISIARRYPQIPAPADPQQPAAEEVSFDRAAGRVSLRPTNVGRAAHSPVIVTTTREPIPTATVPPEDGARAQSDRPAKKRRLNPHAPVFHPASETPRKSTTSEPLTRPTYLSYTTLPHDVPLPNAFLAPHRRSHLALGATKRGTSSFPVITFTSHPLPSGTAADACALRTTTPIPPSCGVFYYEVEVLDQGISGYMSLGFMSEKSDLGRLVGWDKGTFGYHADDGRSFEGQSSGMAFAEKWGAGDIIGCGVDFTIGRAFFTKNGKLLGHRFSKLRDGLYPAIGLRTLRESLLINFIGPFCYDIDAHVRDIRDTVWKEATAERATGSVSHMLCIPETVPASEDGSPERLTTKGELIPPATPPQPVSGISARLEAPGDRASAAFVLDYLRHRGFTKALGSMRAKMDQRGWIPERPPPPPPESSAWPNLQKLGFADLESAIAEAGNLARRGHSSTTLPDELVSRGAHLDPLVLRTVRATMMIDLYNKLRDANVRSESDGMDAAEEEDGPASDELANVLAQGRSLVQLCRTESWDSELEAMLAHLFELLGTPSSSWAGDVPARWAAFGEANEAALTQYIRSLHGLKPRPYLEAAIGQANGMLRNLADQGVPSATFVDIRRAWEDEHAFQSRRPQSPADSATDTQAEKKTLPPADLFKAPAAPAGVAAAGAADPITNAAAGDEERSIPAAETPRLSRVDSRRDLRALL